MYFAPIDRCRPDIQRRPFRCSCLNVTSAHFTVVSKDKRPMICWFAQSGQRNLFTAGFRISDDLVLCTPSNPLANNWWWAHLVSPKMISSFSFIVLNFVVISNPQHPGHNTRCFYRYVIGWVSIHHAIQLRSRSNTEFNALALRCVFRHLKVSYLESWLENYLKPDTHGPYLFNGSYQIVHSLFLPKLTVGNAKSEVWHHQSDWRWSDQFG